MRLTQCTCQHPQRLLDYHTPECPRYPKDKIYTHINQEFLKASEELTKAVTKFNHAKLRMELFMSTWKD